jgi:hypothetical protein
VRVGNLVEDDQAFGPGRYQVFQRCFWERIEQAGNALVNRAWRQQAINFARGAIFGTGGEFAQFLRPISRCDKAV